MQADDVISKFAVNFAGGSSKTLSTNAPLGLGDFGGQAGGAIKGNAFTGDLSVNGSQTSKTMKRQSGGGDITAFGSKWSCYCDPAWQVCSTQYRCSKIEFGDSAPVQCLQLWNNGNGCGRHRKSCPYERPLRSYTDHEIACRKGAARHTRYRGWSDSCQRRVGTLLKCSRPCIDRTRDLQASSDVVQNGSISSTWTDDVTHGVGGTPLVAIIHSGDSTPPERDAPAIDGFALFGERDWVDCSTGSDAKIKCLPMSNMLTLDPSLADEDDNTGLSKRTLDSRAGQGGERPYDVHGPNGAFTINSHTYPNGRNGATLRGVNPAAGYYDLENEDDCVGTEFRDDGDPSTTTFITEHILELQTLPRFLEFAMGIPADLRNGVQMTTRHTPIPQNALGLGSNFLTRYSTWDPQGSANNNEAPVDEIFGAFGDTIDPSHLVNAESALNAMKMRVWRGDAPIADSTWTNNQLDDTSDIAHGEQALSTIRNVSSRSNLIGDSSVRALQLRADQLTRR